jgi:hypothetical protein
MPLGMRYNLKPDLALSTTAKIFLNQIESGDLYILFKLIRSWLIAQIRQDVTDQ